ncbi:hypothetical protein SUGI_0352120 [Cryptomeria japonica]|uniref:laccase-11 n=1 Tax=Cryptomeria japonica TaxID=3369 RepID=UPI002408B363|nr:laccase-11 [Cryptomeria japonica]GLJ19496.1 hypothetical protein SUGI_0352120 [Cryptomeria japonica]
MAIQSTISLVVMMVVAVLLPFVAVAKTRNYNFNIQLQKVSRLCHTKSIVTVNGKFPGPTVYAREGDTVLVNVTNHVKYNITIHWHGIRQFRTGWADGPAYITQCPIQTGQSFLYNYTISGQRGTLLWHAHILWLRVTVHGAIVILPKKRALYPFPKPHKEFTLILGEWWNVDVESIVSKAQSSGESVNTSDAHTINGKPGPLFSCPTKDTFTLSVKPGKTYLLRIINAALNGELFFDIANHQMTVVEVDALYTKPLQTKSVVIAPGQTTNVLLFTNKKTGRYFMAARAFQDAPLPLNNQTATAILQYVGTTITNSSFITMPKIPSINDTLFASNFRNSLRSLNSIKFPAKVPKSVDRHLFFTVGLAINPCPTCINGTRLNAAINNITFVKPTISLLQAHYFNISGVFTPDFPDNPPTTFNYTGNPLSNLQSTSGTRLTRISYNSRVQLVLQDTSLLSTENHPFHLHGFNFFVVGSGIGNYNPNKDPANFNLVDPPERNTVDVPKGGWVAFRFKADNPGVWFMHCHLELHATWGLEMAFLVENGKGLDQFVLPPPKDLPKC